MTFTKALFAGFPKPLLAAMRLQRGVRARQIARRLVCAACGQTAERALPERLKSGKDACKAIDKAERLMGQLDILEFKPALTPDGALVFCDLTGDGRDFAKLLPVAYCFDTFMAALDVDPSYLGPAPDIAVKRDRKRELIFYRRPETPARAPEPPSTPAAAARFWHVCPICGLAGPVDAPGASYCISHARAPTP